MRYISTLLLALLLLISCGSKGSNKTGESEKATTTITNSVSSHGIIFSADSAYRFIQEQLAFGARVPNSKAHTQAGDYIVQKLKGYGGNLIEQRFKVETFDGVKLDARNIIAEFSPEQKERLLLMAHWDCRPWADYDPDPSKRKEPVMGANDGASGVAVLMELARHIGENTPNIGIDILLFDAEDWGDSHGDGGADSWALGSQYWAKNMHREGYAPQYGILLDMVGAPNAKFMVEGYSQQYAPAVVAEIWSMAEQSGHGAYFINQLGFEVLDDHIAVNKAGIPTVDIIDQHNGSGGLGFCPAWHTTYDNIDNISKETLNAVGETLTNLIYKYGMKLKYPESKKGEVVDNYFGKKVADPYRWLEDDCSAETAGWVAAQNSVTNKYLSQIAVRPQLRKRMTELADYARVGLPVSHNGYYYYSKNSGLQNQSVIYRSKNLDLDEGELVLDPNTLSKDGTVALQGVELSSCGNYMSCQVATSGSDWNDIFVMDLRSGKRLDDYIKWCKFCEVQWCGDGFYYSGYTPVGDGSVLQAVNEYHTVYYHKLGTKQTDDRVEFRSSEYPNRFYEVVVSDDEQYIFLTESEGRGCALYAKGNKELNATFKPLITQLDDINQIVGTKGDKLYVKSNTNAPMAQLLEIDIKSGDSKIVIAECDNMLVDVQLCSDNLIVTYEIDASHTAYLYGLDGVRAKEIMLPTLGSVEFSYSKDDNQLLYSFMSYLSPSTIYKYDLKGGESELLYSSAIDFDFNKYETKQLECVSKDGTSIKFFITHSRDLKLDGTNPTLLYGYGGFNISLNPSFSPYRLPFLEMGGIYVVATLRGGGEYGEQWHAAGTKERKQNVFDDFIAVAEYLISEGYTSAKRLAINGGSNGGLLVGSVVNQRPELFAVAIPQVGVMDMLRYQYFTIGWNWASDYGRSDDSKGSFDYLYAYSPLHNIKDDGTSYPAIMVTTADHDDRVVPAHSFKYAATLQAANTGSAPKIIRIDSNAGHGAGKPVAKMVEEQTDIYSFILNNI